MTPKSAYIHIPFCAHKCDFCDFAAFAGLDHMSDEYCLTVAREIQERVQQYSNSAPLETVFYGGGTPGYIEPRLLKVIHDKLLETTGIKSDAEVTLETTPLTITEEKVHQWFALGINRVSMGIESLQDSELKAIGRDHDSSSARAGIRRAKSAGIKNLALDLIYGLPGQTLASWGETLDQLLSFAPDHLSAYGLNVTGSLKLHYPPGSTAYPDDDSFADMYDMLIDKCKAAGLEQYEISNFARPGYESRHNLCYWRNDEYLAFGVGAHRYVNGVRSANQRSFNKYMRDYLCDELVEEIDDERRTSDGIMLGLRLCAGLDVAAFKQRYKVDLLERFGNKLPTLVEGGFMEVSAGAVRLTRKGILVSNSVLAELI